MQPSSPYRPRVTRETRLLLTAGVLAVAALWLLARVRFPDRPVTPNPVPSVLSQLASGPKYADLAAEVAQLQSRLQPSLFVLDLPPAASSAAPESQPPVAVRLGGDLAVTLLAEGSSRGPWKAAVLRGRDRASGLAVVSAPSGSSGPVLATWTPRRMQQPRYFVATEVARTGVSLRPVFVGSLDPVHSPLWTEPVWAAPPRSDLTPGSVLFTSNAELVGMVVASAHERVIVPGATLLAEADRLLAVPESPAGTLGLQVQTMTEALSAVTGAPFGVIVSWVDKDGAAKGQLMVGDVIEVVDSRKIESRQHWDSRMARLTEGETVTLRARRHGEIREVWLVASALTPAPSNLPLGLALRERAKVGAEVTRVDRPSAGEKAGLAVGDVITLVAGISSPTSAHIREAFALAEEGQRVMIAVTRGDTHFVTTLER
jgi:S1-C subfamily serine protease